ncbi:SpoIIE family protein phosphatase [Bacteroidota bacterium]
MSQFNSFLAKYRKVIIIPLSVLLGIIVIADLYFVFEITPQPNDECLWQTRVLGPNKTGFFFDEVKFEGVTWSAGIRDGDQLLEINNRKIDDLAVATFELNHISVGDSAIYTVSRDGWVFETKVEVKKLIQFGGLAFALLGGIWLLIALIVVKARSDGNVQLQFFKIGAAIIIFSIFNLLIGENINNPVFQFPVLTVFIDIVWSFGVAYLPFTIVHFFWIFPRRLNIINKKYTLRILYIMPLIFFFLSVVLKLFYVYLGELNAAYFYDVYNAIGFFLLFLGSIIGLISLFRNYLKLKTKDERNAIFVILISYAIGLLAAIFSSVIINVINPALRFNSPEYFMPIILICAIPIAFGYSIFRYSLMDVSDVIKNAIMYGSATVAIAAFYFLIIYQLGQTISTVIGTEYQGLIAGIVFIIFAIVFQSTKDHFQELITKRFYPEQFAYQRVILKFTDDVSTIVGLENILDSTLNTFVESLNLNKFAIVLRDHNVNKNFVVERNLNFCDNQTIIETNIANLAKSILTKRDTNSPIVIEDTEFQSIFPNFASILREKGIFTIIPLLIKSKIIGFLFFGLKASGSKFAGKDLKLLASASNQVAVALENARLYESEKEQLKLSRDLENARLIQESLLPAQFPLIKGLEIRGKMIPAMLIGGDYFDIIKVSDNKVFVIVGDVSGKGLSASFYMSKLQTMMQLYCTSDINPKDVLQQINKQIYNKIEKNWFITVSIALIDLSKKVIRFCRAGHPPLVLIRNKEIFEYKPNGIGIGLENGIIFNKSLEEIEIPLKENDLFAFYSDGLSETMNSEQEFLGEKRLHNLFLENAGYSLNNILDEILQTLSKFREDTPQIDDLTFVLLRYTKTVE